MDCMREQSYNLSSPADQGFLRAGPVLPWTLSGTLIVDGVAASTHTAWPGEAALLKMLPKSTAVRAAHLLAAAHQTVQAPLRVLYRAVGAWPLAVIDQIVYMFVGSAASQAEPGGMPAAVTPLAMKHAAAATSGGSLIYHSG